MSEIKQFCSNKYSRVNNINSTKCSSFLKSIVLPSLSETESNLCGRPIKIIEIHEALKSMSNNKSPGNAQRIYLHFFNNLGDCLSDCFNKSFELGERTTSQKQAIVTLIEKPGKDHRVLNSWRPISLLNVDVKILSSILSNRNVNLLSKVISPNQSAFVKDRNISDSIRIITDLI